ncbi:hypothetical protein LVJ94_00165 [Pendulispora rubella]|uniref:Uncharacterized protein n=1 Tax=Pendulispora rubella TaxID=2741070 RepID=A0ABZ2L404_9BACT
MNTLSVSPLEEDLVVLGAFQRRTDTGMRCVRRTSGGAAVEVGRGTLHVLLTLEHPAALVPCDALRLVNRYVRPLLAALTKLGQKASYFGRDWISMAKRPIAQVGFAHEASTGRAAFEAFVAVSTPFATGSLAARASFQGKAPATLEDVHARPIDVAALADAIEHAYAEAYGDALTIAPRTAPRWDPAPLDPPWTATAEEAIGEIGAGPDAQGTFRIGGDFLASRDAVENLERMLAERCTKGPAGMDIVQQCVESTFMVPDVALVGVRSPTSLAEIIVRALR